MNHNRSAVLALITIAAIGSSAFLTGSLRAATIVVNNVDGVGEGFNDPTPKAPVSGNAGTTLGQQRLNAFSAAAAYWANRLVSPVQIVISASMDPLACNATTALLGQAGPNTFARDFPNATRTGTWYATSLANAMQGTDLDPPNTDITAQFNSSLNGSPGCLAGETWSYVVGVAAPAGAEPFFETVRHEIAHGLGFTTLVSLSTGARAQGFDDIFMTFLEDHSTGKKWPQMSDGERFTSGRDSGDLHWTGALVQASGVTLSAGRHPSGHVRMFAPSPAQPGSSVTHWDTALSPDEMMEPIATTNPQDIITTAALRDMGWTAQSLGACVRDTDTACLLANRFDVGVTFQSGTSGNAQVMSFGGQRAENNESAFFEFFSPTTFEMGVKMINACSFNGKLWVFVSGLTDQGWVVTVRDSTTGAIKTYSNPVGHLSSTFGDTAAFDCP